MDGAAELHARLAQLSKALTGEEMRNVMATTAMISESDVEQAVRGDLGDESMSNWWRNRPIKLVAESRTISNTEAVVRPVGPARGPMKVRTYGRKGQGGRGTWLKAERLIEDRWPHRALDGVLSFGRKIVR